MRIQTSIVYLLAFVILSISLVSCNRMNQGQTGADEKPDKEATAFLRFQRTACFGTCPIYTVTILQNGEAQYKGDRFVEQVGIYEAEVSPNMIQTIKEAAVAIDFFSLDSDYPAKDQVPTDLPKTITELTFNGKHHKVTDHNYNPPTFLTDFENKIDSLVNLLTWNVVLEED